jgi:hypothetical protein
MTRKPARQSERAVGAADGCAVPTISTVSASPAALGTTLAKVLKGH